MAKFLAKYKEFKLEKSVVDPGPQALEMAHKIAEDIGKDLVNLEQGGLK
jgi:hypothetical protein